MNTVVGPKFFEEIFPEAHIREGLDEWTPRSGEAGMLRVGDDKTGTTARGRRLARGVSNHRLRAGGVGNFVPQVCRPEQRRSTFVIQEEAARQQTAVEKNGCQRKRDERVLQETLRVGARSAKNCGVHTSRSQPWLCLRRFGEWEVLGRYGFLFRWRNQKLSHDGFLIAR